MFRRFADESEIDDWFEEEKDRLGREFYDKSLQSDDVYAGRDEYERRLKALVDSYHDAHARLVKRQERRKRLRAPFERLRTWWARRVKSFKKSWAARQEERKKRKFDRDYARLMRR